jgi:hypothetical protein
MLIRLNRLCRRRDITLRPPPGGPIAAIKNISYNKSNHQSIIGIETHLTETTPYNKKSV